MGLYINSPDFITELMQAWILQYNLNRENTLTSFGLFHWNCKPNRRNPQKPRRIPIIDVRRKVQDLRFKNAIYFLEIDSKTLHVVEYSGIALGGLNIAHEYKWDGAQFCKNPKKLFLMIR
jgi:hypothetical protein